MKDEQYDSLNLTLRAIMERLDRLREVETGVNENVVNLHTTVKKIFWLPAWIIGGWFLGALAAEYGWYDWLFDSIK